MSYGLKRYKTSQANTASREDLLILLYEGAIRFLERSIKEKEGKNLSEHKMYLRRGLAIVAELQATLDFQKGGELAVQLFELYSYMMDRLTEANIKQDMEQIRIVIRNLGTLLEGWREAVKQVQGQAAASAAAAAVAPPDLPNSPNPRVTRRLAGGAY
ncbi:MAG: flagellar export chaperone FliS [Nitrospirae bacterium]|nr:flagellar export chaperone FliS [Magnetococcales bacterium]